MWKASPNITKIISSWTDGNGQSKQTAKAWETCTGGSGLLSFVQTFDYDEDSGDSVLSPCAYVAVGLVKGRTYKFTYSQDPDEEPSITVYFADGSTFIDFWAYDYEESGHPVIENRSITFVAPSTGVFVISFSAYGGFGTISASSAVDVANAIAAEYATSSGFKDGIAVRQAKLSAGGVRSGLVFEHTCKRLTSDTGVEFTPAYSTDSRWKSAINEFQGFKYLANSGTNIYNESAQLFSSNYTGAFSISLWVMPMYYFNGVRLAIGNSSNHFYVGGDGYNGNVYLSLNGETNGYANRLWTGEWHHILATYDGNGTETVFLDGVQKFTHEESLTIGAGVCIGATYPPNGVSDYCLYKNLRIYNRVLTDAEIKALAGELR